MESTLASQEQALFELLISLFNGDELRRWVRFTLGPTIYASLPEAHLGTSTLAFETVLVIVRNNLATDSMFRSLVDLRPRWASRIDEVARLWLKDISSTVEYYQDLSSLGRDEFMRRTARALLVMIVPRTDMTWMSSGTPDILQGLRMSHDSLGQYHVTVYPIEKHRKEPHESGVLVGRGQDNDIVIKNLSLSKRHASFEEVSSGSGPKWTVTDAGSRNGTWASGKRLLPHAATPLNSGEGIQLGELEFMFVESRDWYTRVKNRLR